MKSIKQIKIKTNGKFISNYIEMALNLVKYYPDGLKLVDPKVMSENDYRNIVNTAIDVNPTAIRCIHKSYIYIRDVCLNIINKNLENIKIILDYHYNYPYSQKMVYPLYDDDIQHLLSYIHEQNQNNIIRGINCNDYHNSLSLDKMIKFVLND